MARKISKNFDVQRDLILEGAVEVFAIEGFAQTSMIKVAERAGVSKSLIYHYYTSKEILLFEAMLGYLTRLSEETASVVEQSSEQELRGKLARLLEEYRDARFHHIILMNEVRNLREMQRAQIRALQRRVVENLRVATARCLPDLTGEELKVVTMLFLGMVNWIHTWYSETGLVTHAKLTRMVELMVSGAVRGLAEEPGQESLS